MTELIPAREWLSRKDKNPLEVNPKNIFPPSLPRFESRDHLHDRNRELCVFDPANPGLQTYVRVTRRRHPDRNVEAALHEKRKERLIEQCAIERQEQQDATEMLELRSANIRNLLINRSRGWKPTPAQSRPPSQGSEWRDRRIDELQKRLNYMRSTYAYKGYSEQSNMEPPPPPRTSGTKLPMGGGTMRGGWPVDTSFHGPASKFKYSKSLQA